jgi:outer membrane receptor protein involved in Fe transport
VAARAESQDQTPHLSEAPLPTESESGSASAPNYRATVIGRRPPPPGTRTTISALELSLRGGTNLPEALALEPSIDIQEGPKSGSVLQIRGFDERAVLLLFEGIPIREAYDGHFDIASLPTFALGAIDVERGMTSLLYGPNSGGGIVSLQAPERCEPGADLRLFAGNPRKGTLMRTGAAANLCQRVGPLSLYLAGSYDRSDGYPLSVDYAPTNENEAYHEAGGVRDGSESSRLSAALFAQYAPERNKRVSLFFNYIHAPRGLPTFEGSGFTRYWKFKAYDTLLAGLSAVWGPRIASATWGFREVRVRLYTHQHLDELNDYQDATYGALTTNSLAWFVASSYDNATYGAAAQAGFALLRGNRLDLSLRYQFDKNVQREIKVGQPYAQDSWGKPDEFSTHTFGFALEDTQVLGEWRVLLGIGASGMMLRSQIFRGKSYDAKDRTLPALEGRLVVERSVGEHLVLMAAAGRKARMPLLKELYSNNVGGNDKLKSEFAWMGETGFDFNSKSIHLDASFRIFYNSIENMIEKYYYNFDNVGHAITAGTELELKYSPLPFLQFIGSYRYLYSRDVERERVLDNRTPHKLRLTARYIAPFGLTLSVSGLYNSAQNSYFADQDILVHEKLDGYFLFNAAIRYDLKIASKEAGLYLFANGRNLLDTNYCVGSLEPRPGRELLFGIGGKI